MCTWGSVVFLNTCTDWETNHRCAWKRDGTSSQTPGLSLYPQLVLGRCKQGLLSQIAFNKADRNLGSLYFSGIQMS